MFIPERFNVCTSRADRFIPGIGARFLRGWEGSETGYPQPEYLSTSGFPAILVARSSLSTEFRCTPLSVDAVCRLFVDISHYLAVSSWTQQWFATLDRAGNRGGGFDPVFFVRQLYGYARSPIVLRVRALTYTVVRSQ